MRIGYARVSTEEQELAAQKSALAALGVDRVFTDKIGGKDRDRPGLEKALAALRTGDTLVVHRLDRLGRSVRDLREIADELTEQGVCLQVGKDCYDPTNPVGKMLFTAMSMMAEFERDLISQRTREGMAIAKRRGKLRGRRSTISVKKRLHIVKMYDEDRLTMAEIADIVGVHKSTISRILRDYRSK